MGCSGDSYWEIVDLLKANGAVLDRSKKHRVYKFPDGRIWVVPCSPRNPEMSYKANLCELQKLLGLTTPRGEQPRRERKAKHTKAKAVAAIGSGVNLISFRDKFAAIKTEIHPRCSSGQWWMQRVAATPLTVVLLRIFG